jgi:hypothetical protein
MPHVYPYQFFPSLIGLGYDVKWTPTFFNQSQKTLTGASIDIGLASSPLHTFEFTYNFLRSDATNYELQNLMGFYQLMGGQLGRFLYDNPDDDSVTGQEIGIGDGTTTSFLLTRTLGAGIWGDNALEPIGYFNFDAGQTVRIGGTVFAPSNYTINATTPGNQILTFTTVTPGSGQAITIDYSYFYFCKFAEDAPVFAKFANLFWAIQKVAIQNCRAGA